MNLKKTMKKLLLIMHLLMSVSFACKKTNHSDSPLNYKCALPFADSSLRNTDHSKYQGLLDEMTSSGVPGIMMSVNNPKKGIWLGSSGIADLTAGVPIIPCNITRMGSTVKTFTAAAILKLQEEGKLNLSDKLTDYLNEDVLKDISNANLVTIHQLLNHSTGIYNYIQNLHFQTCTKCVLIFLRIFVNIKNNTAVAIWRYFPF